MDLKQIQYFIACVQKESFSSAAETLFTTQPNVSKTIKALEEELGIQLFERNVKGIRLTEEGKQVFQYAMQIEDNMQKILQFKRTEEK